MQGEGHPRRTVCRWHGGAAGRSKPRRPFERSFSAGVSETQRSTPARSCFGSSPSQPARAERYAILLADAYEAAERLKRSFDAGESITGDLMSKAW
jgi:hypothetical protein